MDMLAARPEIKKATRLYVTAQDVMEIIGCAENKAYETIRRVNEYAVKKGYYGMPQGKANKYLFAEMFGLPQEEVDNFIK